MKIIQTLLAFIFLTKSIILSCSFFAIRRRRSGSNELSLFAHNQAAYSSAAAMLAETGKAAVIHPTGTGKSFIAFKLCEDHPQDKVCWLAPSEYIFRTQQENLKKTGAAVPENIFFCTYAKLAAMSGVILLRPTVSPIIYKQQIARALSAGNGKRPVIFDVVLNIRNLTSISAIREEMDDLGAWLTRQRTAYKSGKLPADKISALEEIGMCWSPADEKWQDACRHAREYRNLLGNKKWSSAYVSPDGHKTGEWIRAQLRQDAGNNLSAARRSELIKLGFI